MRSMGVVPVLLWDAVQAWEFVVNAAPPGVEGDTCPPIPVSPGTQPGLSLCLEEGRLQADGRTIDVSVFDVDALRLAEHALARRASILICPPDPCAPVSALVAAAAHVEAMVRVLRDSGRAAASPLRVAVVTADYRLRGFYRGLAVGERRGVGGVSMRSILPAATRTTGGRLSVVDRDDGWWSTAFVGSIAEALDLGPLDLLVVDLPVFDADRLDRVRVPTVVVAKDPLDPAVAGLASTMPVFGYDGLVVAGDRPAEELQSFPGLANRRAQRVGVVPIVAPAVCANAGLFWGDVSALVRLGRRSRYVSAVIREAFALFWDLIGLAMPVSVFTDLTVRPLAARVADLARAARVVAEAELREDWLPMVEAELGGLLDALQAADRAAENRGRGDVRAAGAVTKSTALVGVVAEALDERRDVVVVARTAPLARAYLEYLHAAGLGGARVTSLGALAETPPGDVAVLLGLAPTWGRWVYRSGLGREFRVLAYTPQPTGTSARSHTGGGGDPDGFYGVGFDEAELVTTAVRRQTASALRLSDPAQRGNAWSALVDGARPGLVGRTDDPADGPAATVTVAPSPPEIPPGLWDGRGWTAPVEPGGADADATGGADIAELVPGLRVTFADGTWTWLHQSSPVWRWRRHAGSPQQVEARSLGVGDEVVFVDGDAHKTLLAKILDVAEGIPELAVAAGWHGHWRAVLGRAHARFGSYAALRQELERLGCGVQAQTVRLWCIGVTIGPDDREDVLRLGRLMGDPALCNRYGDIWRAMQTLRHAHVRLGMRLAALARVHGPAARTRHLSVDEVIDPTSGLTAADLETAVVLRTLTRIEHAAAVPRVLTGRLRQADEPIDLFVPTDSEEHS